MHVPWTTLSSARVQFHLVLGRRLCQCQEHVTNTLCPSAFADLGPAGPHGDHQHKHACCPAGPGRPQRAWLIAASWPGHGKCCSWFLFDVSALAENKIIHSGWIQSSESLSPARQSGSPCLFQDNKSLSLGCTHRKRESWRASGYWQYLVRIRTWTLESHPVGSNPSSTAQ